MALESSQRELQDCFKLHPNRRFEQEVMAPQSCGSLALVVLGLPTPPGQNDHLDVGLVERRRVYYKGEGDDFL